MFAEPPYGEDPAAARDSFTERVQRYRRTLADLRLLLAVEQGTLCGMVLRVGEPR